LVASAQSVGRGGLFAALAKTSLGGQLGVDISLQNLKGKWSTSLAALFSESQGRIIVTVSPKNQKEFEKIMSGSALSLVGTVTSKPLVIVRNKQKKTVLELSLEKLQKAYQSTFPENTALTKPSLVTNKKVTIKPRALVLTGYGINCEEETAFAFEKAGAKARIVHINDLIEKPSLLKEAEILAVPGGFSFGDDTGSGNAFAQKLRNSLWKEILEFVDGDHLVIGICNGCQILVNLGLFPTKNSIYGSREIALLHNDSNLYSDRWVDICVENETPWLKNMTTFSLPIAHGEGKFFAEPLVLDELEMNDQVAARYIRGEACQYFQLPTNPNGSLHKIAALTDPSGKILGIMPHPERALRFTQLPNWTFLKEQYMRQGKAIPEFGPGLQVFQNAVTYFTGETL
jgi:phosphoribosylformylglycinamidine synthase I